MDRHLVPRRPRPVSWRPVMRRRLVLPGLTLAVATTSLLGTSPSAAELPLTRLRIRIAERGIYELAPVDLAEAGVPVDAPDFDPRTLRLFFDTWKPVPLLADSVPSSWQASYEMLEAALWVPGEEDGRLDAADRVVFYALGPAGWDDLAGIAADSLAYSEHPYDCFNYGWLVWGGAAGHRMEAQSASAPEPSTDPLVTSVRDRQHREQDRLFVTSGDLWAWTEIRTWTSNRVEFDLDLGSDSTAAGCLRLQLGSRFNFYGQVTIQLNDVLLGNSSNLRPEVTVRERFEPAVLRNHNVLTLQSAEYDAAGTPLLFELEATWNRTLAADVRGEIAWSGPSASAPNVYELQGLGASEPLVLDVTDWRRPVRLTAPTPVGEPVRWRVRNGQGAGMPGHYLATAAPRQLNPETDLERREVTPLRSHTSCPDMLIVTHPDLLPAAERLAAHRRRHLPGVPNPEVLVTTTRDIYDNFSGGRQDPLAVRNWVKFLWGLSSEPRLEYLLLLGDATRDPRQVLAESPPTLVPAVHPQYADERSRRAYPVEDWFVEMESPAGFDRFCPQADLSIGRLPAQDLAEAEHLVERIVEYETGTTFGPWRGRVLMAADDECNPSVGCREAYFTLDAETLTAGLPAALDVTKIYETEYPLVEHQKPAARAALIRAWSEGCALLSYQGRGNASQLADEVFFLSTDVPALTNATRLPLVLAYHVDAAQFDRTAYPCYMERLVKAANGGAIAAIGSTTSTYLCAGEMITTRQFDALFPGGTTTQQPLGRVHRLAKGTANSSNEHFVLLGDPALVLKIPQFEVHFTAGAESLVAGRRTRIEGIVQQPGGADPQPAIDGRVVIEVLGDADASGYRRTEPPELEITYVLPGAPIYRGEVDVRASRFTCDFTVPLVLPGDSTSAKSTLLGSGGRIAAYAWNGYVDAKGGRDGVVIVRGAAPDSSLGPPQIRLSFPGGATRVASNDTLRAEITDENGVWIAGTDSAGSIWLSLDGAEALDVTAAYRSTGNSDIAGVVSLALPGLPAGPHWATLSAADKLGETAKASLDFEVVDAPVLHLDGIRAGPNPTRVGTDFAFVLDVPAEVDLRLFSVDGRQVYHSCQDHDGLRRGLLRWNGKGTDGRLVASGVYLYRLSVHPAGAPLQEFTGKLAVLR